MQAESLLAASSTQGVAQLCDPRSGALLRTLKDCRPGTNGLCASEHFVATAERDRSFVHLWSWGKEQPHFRCQAPERLTCVAATADGAHCFAGAASGKLYLWQVASGRLRLVPPTSYLLHATSHLPPPTSFRPPPASYLLGRKRAAAPRVGRSLQGGDGALALQRELPDLSR